MLFNEYLKFFSRTGYSHRPGSRNDRATAIVGRVSGNPLEVIAFAACGDPLPEEFFALPAKMQRRKSPKKTRAAVAFDKAKPLTVAEVELDGPKAGEVLVEVKATGLCHTDDFTLSGADPEGLFPAI